MKQNVSKAQSAAKLRAASEAAVAAGKAADHDLLAAFTAYLKLEEASGDAARLQVAAHLQHLTCQYMPLYIKNLVRFQLYQSHRVMCANSS